MLDSEFATWKHLPNAAGMDINYVVPDGEGNEYVHSLPPYIRVIETPANVIGIADTRLFIGDHAGSRGFSRFCMMDDDLKFYKRESHKSTRLIHTVPDDMYTMLTTINDLLNDYALVGVSARGGNNNVGKVDFTEATFFNERCIRVLAYRTNEFLAMKHGRVPVMEDFDVNLQLLEHGYPNAILYWFAQDQQLTQRKGGCSTYRTHELHEKAAHELKRLHPKYVRLTEKKNKTGGEFGTRTEVIIQWKKAIKDSMKLLKENGDNT
jgi:hypothetical protein